MLKKFVLVLGVLGLVAAVPLPASAVPEVNGATAAIVGTVSVETLLDQHGAPPKGNGGGEVTVGSCSNSTYSHRGEFNDVQMAGTFVAAVPGPPAAYIGTVTVDEPIEACINSIVEINHPTDADETIPLVSEGDIRGDAEDDCRGMAATCDGDNRSSGTFGTGIAVLGDIEGDIDRGGFVTVGIAAAAHFSIDYTINPNGPNPSDARNVSCLGSFVVVPGVPIPPDTIAGGIGCLQLRQVI